MIDNGNGNTEKMIGGRKTSGGTKSYQWCLAYRRYRKVARVYNFGVVIFSGDPDKAREVYNRRLEAAWRRAYGQKPPSVVMV